LYLFSYLKGYGKFKEFLTRLPALIDKNQSFFYNFPPKIVLISQYISSTIQLKIVPSQPQFLSKSAELS